MKAERLQRIAQFIKAYKQATVEELVTDFGVSEATIRRDLDELERKGEILRIHGGAVDIRDATPESPVVLRTKEHQVKKQRIGQAAAQLIKDGETIFLGSGTTTLEVARNLSGKKNLTVITNALNIACELSKNEDFALILTGGFLRHSELSMIGHLTVQVLSELRADKVIMGMRAISLEGA